VSKIQFPRLLVFKTLNSTIILKGILQIGNIVSFKKSACHMYSTILKPPVSLILCVCIGYCYFDVAVAVHLNLSFKVFFVGGKGELTLSVATGLGLLCK